MMKILTFRNRLTALCFIMCIGLASSIDLLEEETKERQFNYEDNVTGNGFFASNNIITVKGPHADAIMQHRLAKMILQKKDHGSGSIEKDFIIKSNEFNKSKIDPEYVFGHIAASDNHRMIYGHQTMSIGNGYYITHPINFNIFLGDTTQIENYASKTSMSHEIEYANAINMDLAASTEDDYSGQNSSGRARMNLEGSVTSGIAHLTMLQGGNRLSKIAWSEPDIDLDQIYSGTFDFATKMNLTSHVMDKGNDDPGQMFCTGGWEVKELGN